MLFIFLCFLWFLTDDIFLYVFYGKFSYKSYPKITKAVFIVLRTIVCLVSSNFLTKKCDIEIPWMENSFIFKSNIKQSSFYINFNR